MADPMDADNRFVYGPYSKFPYPYDVGYPGYTYPKADDPRVIRMIQSADRTSVPRGVPKPNQPKKVETNSLKSVVADKVRTAASKVQKAVPALTPALAPIAAPGPAPTPPPPPLKRDNRMRPYIFRHYIPPTYYELWDYNMADLEAAKYNELLRQQMAHEVYLYPGEALGRRRKKS
jgi:hypothetical protein